MKYYTIAFPGECGQHVQETWSEDQIIQSYWIHWFTKMVESGAVGELTRERCIDDWRVVHWAVETDEFGNR